MTKCNQTLFAFPSCKSRKVIAGFSGGNISSLGGVMLLSSLADILFDHLRRTALQNTRLARATSAAIRIGAVLLRNTRRVRLHLSSS